MEQQQEIEEKTAKEIGRRITASREKLGWSRYELARRCGVHADILLKVEKGYRMPSIATLLPIASACGVSLRDLIPEGC
jgi:transcriptional regulator with XRE-family HTH domain